MSETWITGIHPVESALSHDPARIRSVVIEQGARNRRLKAIEEQARKVGVVVRHVTREALERVADGSRHQGIAASFDAPAAGSEDDLQDLIDKAGRHALFLVLDGVTDPHNLGACLRSAAAAGATAVIVPKDRAVAMTPVVRKAAAGGAERVPLLVVTNLARTLRDLKDAGVWLTGLAGEGDASVFDQDLRGPAALVLGSEGEGLRRLTRDTCDFLARIPMPGGMESLNVSVAAGIVLFEAVRQRSDA